MHYKPFQIPLIPFALLVLLALPPCVAVHGQISSDQIPESVTFNAHIRPIMSNTCFVCHGPDEEVNDSGLRLDSYRRAVQLGRAIEPGNPESSAVWQRISDDDDPMPPQDFLHQLTDRDKQLIKKWIQQGAKYEAHWSYAPIRKSDPPRIVADENKVRNEIDRFVFQKLHENNLAPADQAEKATLLRRLYLDLIGLPPTRKQLAEYLADQSPDAYEQQVDRLLASEKYGERMASQWLDLVRFSDTVGFHGDQNQRIFPYRDYVIDALNQNMPFDQFTREQLAGDLLENGGGLLQNGPRVATGLVRLNMMTREGGAQPKEYLAKYTADRVRMIGTAWLGSTTACCECHNHKYDPFTIKDFYSLGAFFDDIQQWGVYTTYGYTPNEDLRGFNNDYPFPPEIRVRSESLVKQIEHLEGALAKHLAGQTSTKRAGDNAAFTKFADSVVALADKHPDGWIDVENPQVSTDGSGKFTVNGGDILLTGKPKSQTWTVQFPLNENFATQSVRIQVLPDAANGGTVGRSSSGQFSMSLEAVVIRPSDSSDEKPSAETVVMTYGQADFFDPRKYRSGKPPLWLGPTWHSGPGRFQLPDDEANRPHTAVWHLPKRFTAATNGSVMQLKIKTADLGKFRISTTPLVRFVVGDAISPALGSAIQAYAQKDQLVAKGQRQELLAAWHLSRKGLGNLDKPALAIRDRIVACRSGYAMSLIVRRAEKDKQIQTRILPRGDWQSTDGAIVQPATPEFLPRLNITERRLNRLDLANWLTSDQNPLVARHYVNRTWKHFFGQGISGELEDLGNQGEWPSHPQLLDWLAAEFRQSWDMKALNRLIVTSHTYRQKAAFRDDLAERDPYNRLLSQQTARRLEAEAIRDNALSIAGLLFDRYTGGPSVMPYQPPGHYRNLQFPNRRYRTSTDFLRFRRGLYMHWQRTFLHPMLVNFDAPSRDECTANRTQSNSPQQALTLLNDPQFVEASTGFALRIFNECPKDDFASRLNFAFETALARSPVARESEMLLSFADQQRNHFRDHPRQAKETLAFAKSDQRWPDASYDQIELAAWVQICRVILNLHETITRY